ncbi:MAG: NADH-quinone oxidoreductase subunit L [Roseibacillus sp.]|nr:NADH-quinone oxidoreductase subunit L [Roseibacillus sp.]
MLELLAWLLLLLPLFSAAAIQLWLKEMPGTAVKMSVFSAVTTFLLALILLGGKDTSAAIKWASAGSFHIEIGLIIDNLSKGMMLVVTGVGLLVHLFSLGYMKDDGAKARYFGGLSIFMFSMTGIVLASNFIMMFIFWELVGFSSYLLIGHWFQKNSAAEAAKKAFLVNRIGDFGFMIGILMLWGLFGTFAFSEMEEGARAMAANSETITGIAVLLIFCGAVGKSAQFPLHVWLPDAMEGPTPVSALIHAATMVAAGVYMLFRLQVSAGASLFEGFAGTTIAWIGGITSLLAALMATQQDDIKRILAYSTLSQLGYMVMAVGLAGGHGGEAGMFHLYTHAWFKALLFLGSGAIIYACHHEQDIWKMGGLLGRMRKTAVTFAIGTAALMAIYPLSGFWSKEQILETAHHENPALFWLSIVVAALTPFYMTRLFIVAFLGRGRTHGAKEAREVPGIMLYPLFILAAMSVIAGFSPIAGKLAPAFHHPEHTFNPANPIFLISLAALGIGIAAGILLYRGRDSDPLAHNRVFKLFRNKFYLDELYLILVKFCQDTVAAVIHFFDEFLIGDLIVGGLARSATGLGNVFRRLQSGNLQGYAILFGVGIILIIYLTVFAR